MSGTPSFDSIGRRTSSFFAVHGMSATEKSFAGSMPLRSANHVFTTAPNIIMGLFAVDRCGSASRRATFACLTHAGQQLVNIGHTMPFSSGVRSARTRSSSVASSMMVRSAAKQVSNT